MLGLDDLGGTNDSSLFLGFLGGNPQTGATTYDGTNDLSTGGTRRADVDRRGA